MPAGRVLRVGMIVGKNAAAMLRKATAEGRPVAVVRLTDLPVSDSPLAFSAPDKSLTEISALEPHPWAPQFEAWADALRRLDFSFETVWFSDGLVHGQSGRETLLEALRSKGSITVVEGNNSLLALREIQEFPATCLLQLQSGRQPESGIRYQQLRLAWIREAMSVHSPAGKFGWKRGNIRQQ